MYRTFLLVAALVAAPPASAQQEEPYRPDSPIHFRVEVNMVFSYVSARGPNNEIIRDLKKNDFRLTDHGVPQEITFFEREDLPLRIVLMMDVSRSMDDRIIQVRDSVWAITDSLREQDLAKVILFDREGWSHGEFTNDKKTLKVFADSFGDGNDTRLYTALYVQITEIEKLDVEARREGLMYRNVIIVFTDGEDTGSLHSDEEILGLARDRDMVFYTVHMPRLPEDPRQKSKPKTNKQLVEERFLLRLAEDTGGRMFVPMTPDEVREAYLRITEDVASHYKIGYSPVVPDSPAVPFRLLSFTLKDRENVYLQHRRGYAPRR